MAEALYRKYRPQVFADVVGQEPIERTLKNAIEQDKVSHAYLFCGPRGTGKTTTARLLAKALLCQQGPTPEPDGECEDCRLIADGVHPDVYELDAASRTGVENVREEIISRVQFAPTRGRSKIYIIDEVHMLSTAAFNALLKTLEEPPSHVVFILCTTDPQKVPETIHSRCQRFDFRRIAPENMVSRLGAICVAEGVEFEGEALDLIAHRAEGGLRNALTSLEQIIAFENGRVTLAGAERLLGSIDSNDLAEIMAYVGTRDIANCFRWTANYVETGADLAQFVRDMGEHVRNLYVLALAGDDMELDVSETVRRELSRELQWFGPDRASRMMGVLGDLSEALRTSSNPRLAFEIALTRMVRPDSDLTIEALAERIEALESGYSAVAHVLPGQPAGAGLTGQAAGAGLTGVEAGLPGQAGSGQVSPEQVAPGQAVGAGLTGQVSPEQVSPGQPVGAGLPASGGASGSQAVLAAGDAALPKGEGAEEKALKPQGADVSGMPVREDGRAKQNAPWEDCARNTAGGVGEASSARVADTAGETAVSHAVPEAGMGAGAAVTARDAAAAAQPEAPAAGTKAGSHALANPASLQRIWQATLTSLRKEKQAYGVLFMNTKAEFDEATETLNVEFPAESTFAFNTAQKADVQDLLAQVLQKMVGEPVRFKYVQVGGAARANDAAGMPHRTEAAAAPRTSDAAGAQRMTEAASAPRANDATSAPRTSDATSAPHGAEAAGVKERPAVRQQPESNVVPYEEVPYEDLPYDPVPYEEFDAPVRIAGDSLRSQPVEDKQSPGSDEQSLGPEELQALLQAGFGNGVVISEVEE